MNQACWLHPEAHEKWLDCTYLKKKAEKSWFDYGDFTHQWHISAFSIDIPIELWRSQQGALRDSITDVSSPHLGKIQALSSQTVPAPVHPWRPVIAAEITSLRTLQSWEKNRQAMNTSVVFFHCKHIGACWQAGRYFDAKNLVNDSGFVQCTKIHFPGW